MPSFVSIRMKRATVVVIPLLVVAILLFIVSRWWEPAPLEKKELAKSAAGPSQENSQPGNAQVAAPPGLLPTVEEGRSAVERVTRMITAFHTRMGENPVGTNAEITKALMGGNPVHATFTPDQDRPSINSKGELIDPWGTPYFFHQISGDHMEIHSAGPDKIMGTADDIIEN
jgi:hypothetical protein